MNVPDLARRAAISEQQKLQAQAADAGLHLKIAVECFVKEYIQFNRGSIAANDAEVEYAHRATMAVKAANAFMSEYKQQREVNSQIPEGWRITRDGEGWEAVGPKSRSWAESREAVIKWAISEAEKENAASK